LRPADHWSTSQLLPGDRACLPPSPAGSPRKLDASVGRQDHTALPSAPVPLVFDTACVHRIPRQRFVTTMIRPSERARDGALKPLIWGRCEARSCPSCHLAAALSRCLASPRNDEPSLRANGSRECAPDDRLREAIHVTASGDMDCFVASLLAMTAVRILSTRMRPSSCHKLAPPKNQGRRECRARAAPAVSYAKGEVARMSIQAQRRHPDIPCAMVYGLFRALVSAKYARMCERAVLNQPPVAGSEPDRAQRLRA
jgi:hypothetical protein